MRRTLPTPCLWQIALALDEAHRSSSLPFLPVQFLEKKPSDALVVMAMYSASHDERTIDSDCRSVCVATLHSGKKLATLTFFLVRRFPPQFESVRTSSRSSPVFWLPFLVRRFPPQFESVRTSSRSSPVFWLPRPEDQAHFFLVLFLACGLHTHLSPSGKSIRCSSRWQSARVRHVS